MESQLKTCFIFDIITRINRFARGGHAMSNEPIGARLVTHMTLPLSNVDELVTANAN